MNPISMSTRDLRAILREAEGKELGVVVRVAEDICGPGGPVFIAANSKLTERHLAWLEQRNPASDTRPTYVEIVISHEARSGRLPDNVGHPGEPATSVRQHRHRATEISGDVVTKADDVAQQAAEVYRIVGEAAFNPSALRNRNLIDNLWDLNARIQKFHASVKSAIDEYLVGNTLIMDLIAKHGLATRTVQHGLNVAVFATEVASQVVLKSHPDEDRLGGYYSSLSDDQVLQQLGRSGDTETVSAGRDPRWLLFQRDLAEIFLGGFVHDCGLWGDADEGESHEITGARLIWNIPEMEFLLPSLTKIVLFHSDVIRISSRPRLVQIIEYPDDPSRTTFRAEYYRSTEDAHTAARMHGDQSRAEILDDGDLHKALSVALAEYCISQTTGFNARSRVEVVSRLADCAREGPYLTHVVALCNAQVEVVAPRRSYVELRGSLRTTGASLDVNGFEGGSMWHSDDRYSPHLILLFEAGPGGAKQRLEYISPHDARLWARPFNPGKRMYIPAGRYRGSLDVRVTGFMSEDVFENILGEYELELKRQMQG